MKKQRKEQRELDSAIVMESEVESVVMPEQVPEQVPDLSELLFKNAMKGLWCEVVKAYETNADSHHVVLTDSFDTALHLAVSDGKPKIVSKLVEILGEKASEILKLKNKIGNTPLHTAAELGDSHMCFCMASKEPSIISVRNNENATPLFLAAKFGHKDAFLCLHFLYKEKPSEIFRKDNGDTILHAALRGEFFGIIVNEMKDKRDSAAYLKRFHVEGTKVPWYAETYGTCAQFSRMPLKKIRSWKASGFKKNDEENVAPQQRNSNHGKGTEDEEKDKQGCLKNNYLTHNFATFIQYLKLLLSLLLIVLGFGFPRIHKIIIKKERHTWALQVMNELMKETSLYKYNEGQTAKDGKFDNTFDPRLTGAPQGMEADGPEQHQVIDANLGQNSPSVNKYIKDSSNKEGIVVPMESFLKEYRIVGSVDVKSSKHAVKMAFEKRVTHEPKKTETPILIAAKMGVTEMVESILEKFPVSIRDLDANNKNVLLLAVENRQSHTFRFLIKRKAPLNESVFRHWDNQGNNALHLAATCGEYRPWLIPGSALQMQWELKWYKFVKNSISHHLLVHYNHQNQTPKQIFTATHKSLVKDGSEWLTKTSESCSLVAALIATVAFATSATIPGGVKENTGKPVLGDEPAFVAFSISSLVALCFSVTALVLFLAILTSRFEEKDFAYKLPWKLILGLTALFTSIAAILVSFCAGHFFELRDKLKFAAFSIYIVTCLPVSFFALAQLPLYFDLLRAIIQEVPQRSQKEFTR